MHTAQISPNNPASHSFLTFSVITTAAMGVLGYGMGVIVNKINPTTSPLFPLIVAVNFAASTALNATILFLADNNKEKYQIKKYQVNLAAACGYALICIATLATCIALGIYGVPLGISISGSFGPLFNKLLEARNEYVSSQKAMAAQDFFEKVVRASFPP